MSEFSTWFKENLEEEFRDIAEHGADAGFAHITYTSDCVDLYEKYESDIWDMLQEDADDFGYKNPMELVATFNRQDMLEDPDQFKNLLVWYACEREARNLNPDI